MNAFPTAAAGMNAALARYAQSAQRTARWSAQERDADLAAEAVEQVSSKAAFSANAQVAKTADEMAGSLLNILA